MQTNKTGMGEGVQSGVRTGVSEVEICDLGSGSTSSCPSLTCCEEVEWESDAPLGCACACTHRVEPGVPWWFAFCTALLRGFTVGWDLLV